MPRKTKSKTKTKAKRVRVRGSKAIGQGGFSYPIRGGKMGSGAMPYFISRDTPPAINVNVPPNITDAMLDRATEIFTKTNRASGSLLDTAVKLGTLGSMGVAGAYGLYGWAMPGEAAKSKAKAEMKKTAGGYAGMAEGIIESAQQFIPPIVEKGTKVVGDMFHDRDSDLDLFKNSSVPLSNATAQPTYHKSPVTWEQIQEHERKQQETLRNKYKPAASPWYKDPMMVTTTGVVTAAATALLGSK